MKIKNYQKRFKRSPEYKKNGSPEKELFATRL